MKGRKHITRFTIVMVMAVLAVGVFAGAALAAAGDADLTGTAAPAVTGWTPGTFSATLTGAAAVLESTNFSGFTVTDATGEGKGWIVTVAAGQFSDGTHSLAKTALSMPAYSVSGNAGSTTAPTPSITAGAWAVVSDGTEGNPTVELAHANAGEGMGIYTFSTLSPWKLSIPTNVYEGDYNSAITVTVAQHI